MNCRFKYALAPSLMAVHTDNIVPVPLGKKRLKERGYNQAALIAKPLSRLAAIPYEPSMVKRIKETKSQVGMSINERRMNMEDAFLSQSINSHGMNFLIIDDVFTSGSTMDSCARALKDAGADLIYGLTVARTMLK